MVRAPGLDDLNHFHSVSTSLLSLIWLSLSPFRFRWIAL